MEKKFYRKVRSKLKKRIYEGGRVDKETKKKYNLTSWKPNSKYSEEYNRPYKRVSEFLNLTLPETFCLIQDHENTIKFLNKLDSMLSKKIPKHLTFNINNVKHIGLSASFLFDKRINEYYKYWNERGYQIGFAGNYSKTKNVNNFLMSFGLAEELNIKEFYNPKHVDPDYREKFITFKFEGNQVRDYEKGNAANGLADYFQQCFNYNGFEIKNDAKNQIALAATEILGNAEEHSGIYPTEWNVLGFYDKEAHICYFCIVNYGLTIYETLSNENSTSREVLKEIEGIITSHRTFFEKTARSFTRYIDEPIWTSMALQDGISSKKTLKGRGSTRGQGLMDVLNFIDDIRSFEDQTNIVVISGKSKINIDFTYPINEFRKDEKIYRQIIFNKEQNLQLLPDSEKVISMSDSFKGTIITGKFKINEEFLNSIINGN